MNKNYKEQYLKVKDIREEECNCISLSYMQNLIKVATQLGHSLRKALPTDIFLSSETHFDLDRILIYENRFYVRFQCLEQPFIISPENRIQLHCGEMGETYCGLQKQTGLPEGVGRFIELLSSLSNA